MLAKLSFRNAKRQAHDYIIYFVTLTAIFSLIHGLNSLLFAEDDIFPLDDSTFILPMILISSLLFSISLWLTSYMTNFILKRRSKEISIYITLGMEPYQISKVFTLENFYISIFALILSFLCGSFVYQVLKAVSFNLLGKPYSLTFHFSLYPCAEQHSTLDIGDNNLSFAGICTEPLDQYDGYSNGNLFLLVVPDSVVGSLSTYYSKYSTLMDEPFSHAEYCEMQDVFPNLISLRSDSSSSLIKSSPVDYIDISDDIRQTNGFLYITSALPVLYIAIILSVSGFTVIASNVLCENLKASHDFRILKNIGYDIHTLEKITLYHLSAIFIIPLFSAVLFSFFISFTYCRSCGALYFVPFKKLLFCFFVSIIVFTLLYGIYFAICFTSLRKEIIFTD